MRLKSQIGIEGLPVSSLNCDRPLYSGIRAQCWLSDNRWLPVPAADRNDVIDLTMYCALSVRLSLSADLSPCTGCYKLTLMTLYGGPTAAVR